MGTRNQERRRAKKQRRETRQRERNARRHYAGAFPGSSISPGDLVDFLVQDAAHAGCEGDDPGPSLARLVDYSAGAGWCSLVSSRVMEALTQGLAVALHGGWEPRDLTVVLRRKVGSLAAGLAKAVLADAVQRRGPAPPLRERWLEQLADDAGASHRLDFERPSWGTEVAAAVMAIGFLGHLGALPDLEVGSAPRQGPRADLDPAVLAKVRGLLAKAEGTEFEHEAETFLAKAQALMTRHNLDRAAVEASARSYARVEAYRCWLEDPYLKEKGLLLAVVARANRCRTVAVDRYGLVTVFGHPDDLAATDMLFTALLVHATNQMTLPGRIRRSLGPARDAEPTPAGPLAGRHPGAGSRPRLGTGRPSYRRSFLVSYATRVGARLREAAGAATEAAVETTGGALLPVLLNRERGVEEALSRMFPETKMTEFSVTDPAGWAAGRAAADLADLSWQPRLTEATG